ncbi:hypothetical protein ADK86_17965 [Streptomyces sp. NRRL F-5755]|uniref:hypothetical protein n=1 Tax=Streptomyces sp. NRRL F-5755 TaxID=1519475 RepID=UPI0006AEA8B5|nr:hypothetical protein [Streptomyces sp. NRRL F-5755]KOT94605.1 hypothetical protein ADK86_17965 [Streptomyces sp. NRRL F-5755]
MSKILSLIKELQGEAKARALFSLNNLKMLGNEHVKEFQTAMQSLEQSPITPVKIPATTVRHTEQAVFAVKEVPDDQFTGIFNSLLGDQEPDFKKILKNLIQGALNTLLGNVSVGESTYSDSYISVIPEAQVVTRVDVLIWRYQFESHGLTATAENAFVYGLNVGVVDPNKTSEYVLRWLLWQMVVNDKTIPEGERKKRFEELWQHFKPKERTGGLLEEATRRHKELNEFTAKVNETVRNPSAMDSWSGATLYLACSDEEKKSGKIWAVNTANREVTLVAGSGKSHAEGVAPTEAELVKPTGVAACDESSFLIADYATAKVRLVSNNVIKTVFDGTKDPGSEADPIRPACVNASSPERFSIVAYQEGDKEAPLRLVDVDLANTSVKVVKQQELQFPSQIKKVSPEVHGILLPGQGDKLVSFSGNGFVAAIPWEGKEATVRCGLGEETGDGERAKNLLLRCPRGLAFDQLSNLFIADGHSDVPPYHSSVRMVTGNTAEGTVRTVVSGSNIHAVVISGKERAHPNEVYTLADDRHGPGRVFRAHPYIA